MTPSSAGVGPAGRAARTRGGTRSPTAGRTGGATRSSRPEPSRVASSPNAGRNSASAFSTAVPTTSRAGPAGCPASAIAAAPVSRGAGSQSSAATPAHRSASSAGRAGRIRTPGPSSPKATGSPESSTASVRRSARSGSTRPGGGGVNGPGPSVGWFGALSNSRSPPASCPNAAQVISAARRTAGSPAR